jgi:uncharacterized secreted protein with C-terminal beta-propeller domain
MTFKKVLSLSFASILLASNLAIPSFAAESAEDRFTDLSETYINLEAIEALQSRDVLEGYKDGTFRPENRINRAEMVKIMIESLYESTEIEACLNENPDSLFSDVPAEEWFAPYICIAKRDGIVSGYEDGTFRPADYINFVELSKILNEAMDFTTLHEVDGVWYEGYVRALELKKAIPSSIEFFDEDITRGEMSEMMWRLSDNVTNKVSATYDEISEQLPKVSSCEALTEKVRAHESYYFYDDFFWEEEMWDEEDVSRMDFGTEEAVELAAEAYMEKSVMPTSAGGAAEYSETNLQVAGVDEADIVKNDDQYIYLLKGNTIKIVQAYPALAMSEVASFKLGTESDFTPEQMFLNGDQLIVIGYTYDDFYMPADSLGDDEAYFSNFYDEKTIIFTLDISDKTNIQESRRVTVDGYYNTARRIGDNLHVVLNQYVDYYYYGDYYEEESGEELLPKIQLGEEEPNYLVDCTDIAYLPGHDSPNYTEIISFDLSNPSSEISAEVLLGNPDTVFMSQNNLYVAQRNYDYLNFTDWDSDAEDNTSHIFKFELQGPSLDFMSLGEVPGYPLNQFSMDEYNGEFRIATTVERNWRNNTPSKNGAYVLDENMQIKGQVTDLAPGEDIYSARFIGDRLYLVTFEQVDPLFVIDLSNSSAPKVLGELKIPGYSTYLHPYDENHLIGFGEDVIDPDLDPEIGPAWRQGFKMALFDVSDPTNPQQKFVENIGDRGTYSDLLYNHKALLFEPASGLLAFPITVNKVEDAEELSEYELTWAYGDPVFQGAYVYKLDLENGFQFQGKVTHYDELDFTDYGLSYNSNKEINRIVRMDDILYTISESIVTALNKDTVEEITSLILN